MGKRRRDDDMEEGRVRPAKTPRKDGGQAKTAPHKSASDSVGSSDTRNASHGDMNAPVLPYDEAHLRKPRSKHTQNDTAIDEQNTPTDRAPKKSRFIVFVGNLPYTATNDSVAAHFDKIHPDSIRHITERSSQGAQAKSGARIDAKNQHPKSKGFAFLEFNGYDRMKTCLKLYHHSDFNDGKSPMRKINVELTAGGGGRGDARREKLKMKNAKLEEERKQHVATRQAGKSSGTGADGRAGQSDLENGIHPSRRARIKLNQN